MSKKQRDSIYVIHEGYIESYFLEYLAGNSNVKLNGVFANGGSADSIVIKGINHSCYECPVYIFFDEDFQKIHGKEISKETIERLAELWETEISRETQYRHLQTLNKNNRNPILIISNPKSFEGIILQACGYAKNGLEAKTTVQLKNQMDALLKAIDLTENDKQKLQEFDERIKELRDKLSKLSDDEVNAKNKRRSFEQKIKDCERMKKRISIMRFFCIKLPIDTLKNINVLEIQVLLKAFQIIP
jgi:hypothetical protein